MDDCLADAPHGRVYRSHEEVAVLVDEGDGCGGYQSERERNHEAHDEDHHAVESSQFVPPQCGESYEASYHVNDSTGEDTPDEHTQPGGNILLSSHGVFNKCSYHISLKY